jgi:hypothetical protein
MSREHTTGPNCHPRKRPHTALITAHMLLPSAASGELEMGRHLIYRTGAWVAPQLQRMVQQQQDEGGQGAAALPVREALAGGPVWRAGGGLHGCR